MTVTKKDLTAALKARLAVDARWAQKGLLRIYKEQTDAEKATSTTREDNGVGFSGFDAEILTSLVEWIQAGRDLTPWQVNKVLLKKMPKYAGQLIKLTNDNEKMARSLGLIQE